jgi:hypothetical protein
MHMHFFILRTYEMKELIRKFYDGIFCVIIRRKVSYREIACVPNGTFSSFFSSQTKDSNISSDYDTNLFVSGSLCMEYIETGDCYVYL